MKNIMLIGYGRFGTILYQKFNSFSPVSTVCVRNKTEHTALLEKTGVKVSTDYRNELTSADTAIIATPAESHFTIAKDCLNAGVDIFIEKPITQTLPEVEELFALAKEKNCTIYVDDVFRFRPEYSELKKQNIEINQIKLHAQKYGTFDQDILHWYPYHDAYLLVDLLDDSEIKDVKIIRSETPFQKNCIDILEYTFIYSGVKVHASYDRTKKEKDKVFQIDDSIVWENDTLKINNQAVPTPTSDALENMITTYLAGKSDITYNNFLAKKSLELLTAIQKQLPHV